MISTRQAGPDEYQLLADLGRKAFYEAFASYNDPQDMQTYLDLSFNPEVIREQLLDKNVVFFIATYENDPVGYAKLKRKSYPPELKNEKCIQLERIYARQAFIGKKIGKVLMEECIRLAESENLDYIWLSVWQQNDRAITFYKKWGFEIIGVKQFLIGKSVSDDFVMSLRIKK